jgi:asparagine synthase (glutamine-hydrolysing)
MCGIFGVTNFDNNIELARKALNTLQHRGPDQWNEFVHDDIYLGHQRLSILDTSDAGIQPMISEDLNFILTCNGEIYNFIELKSQLETKYNFKSSSDSEILLYGYIEWGIDLLLEKIDGMYSFVIYDKVQHTIILARDRYGIKPLYYSDLNNQFVWASELKAIQNFYESDNLLVIDYTSIYDFLTYHYIPTPKSLYINVYKLEPAHYLTIDLRSNTSKKTKYWNLNIIECDDDLATASSKIIDLLKDSIKEQMVADVPIGFFLSGGLDSSLVVALASEFNKSINTFSIGFPNTSHDESKYANIVAKKFETKHTQQLLAESDISDITSKILNWYDEPFGDTSCYPTFLVSKLARSETTVVLTGDGGDEVFGGYKWYKDFEKIKNISQYIPVVTKNIFNLFLSKSVFFANYFSRFELYFILDDLELYSRLMGGMSSKEKLQYRNILKVDANYDDYWYFRKFYKPELDIYTRLQYLDFHTYLPDDIFTKVDRTSMAVSLECRIPIINKKIVEYCFSLNPKIRIYNGELKGFLKQALKGILPIEILSRDKKGFSIPHHSWRNLIKNKSKQFDILEKFKLLSEFK